MMQNVVFPTVTLLGKLSLFVKNATSFFLILIFKLAMRKKREKFNQFWNEYHAFGVPITFLVTARGIEEVRGMS